MTQQKKNLGALGEKIAANFLRENKYKILAKNFHTRFGELDIVALDHDTLVFVEVKTRTSAKFGLPEEAISFWKLKTMEKVGQLFRLKHEGLPQSERLDVVAIEIDSQGIVMRKELLKNVGN